MNWLRTASAACVVLAISFSFANAEEKADVKKLIVGKWEVSKADEGTLPKGTIIEYTKDGKLKLSGKKGDKDFVIEGTYTVDGSSFTYKLTVEGKENSQKITIKKISETEMDTTSPDNKAVTLKRVK